MIEFLVLLRRIVRNSIDSNNVANADLQACIKFHLRLLQSKAYSNTKKYTKLHSAPQHEQQ